MVISIWLLHPELWKSFWRCNADERAHSKKRQIILILGELLIQLGNKESFRFGKEVLLHQPL
jgi:hypothetical protein